MNPQFVAAAVAGALLLVAVLFLAARGLRPKRRKSSTHDLPPALPGTSARDPRSEVMAGGLQHMALPDLLQFLAQGGHTGTLQITSGRRQGTVRMVQGLVIHSEYRRKQDLDAMYELLSLTIGDFRFRFETPPNEPVRGREVVDILMLWLAHKEESK